MSARGLVESSPEADRTIRAPHAIFPHISQSSLPEHNNSPSSSKASLVAQQKLGDFFPSLALAQHSATSKTKYTDASLQQIANLLRLSDRARWSAVPRLYTVLRSIGQLQLIDDFIDEGFTDIWFPFTPHNLPPRLSPSIKTQFLTAQSVVFTQALDLEKREGRHATFAADEPLWFESRGKLGRGAFGVVDKVVSLITLQEYARKRMRRGNNFTRSKKEIKEFKAELAILKTVNHHHCVRLVGSYTDPVYLGLIMDPVADCDLGRFLAEALINNDKKSLLRSYFGCLVSALQYLHDRQIRHRDIKPPNILVKGDTVYLADFGIALDWSEMTRGTTTADTAKSPIYCAPEVARSESRGQSADIWSLGCVFVEMVTVLKGSSVDDMRSSFKKTSGSYMFHHNIQACDQWLSYLKDKSAIDNAPIEWCQKMLLFDRNERYTASQLLEAIQIESEPDHLKYVNQSFCGDCCMDQEHVSSNDSDGGDDPWADSEEEDTFRANYVSNQESFLKHTYDRLVPGLRETTPEIPDVLSHLDTTSHPETHWKLSHVRGVPSNSTTHVSRGEHSSLETATNHDQEPLPRKEQSPTNESQNTSELERLAREEWREEDCQKPVAEWNVTDTIGLGKQRRRTSKEAGKRDEEKVGQHIAAVHAGQEQLEGAETIDLDRRAKKERFEEVKRKIGELAVVARDFAAMTAVERKRSEEAEAKRVAQETAEESDNQNGPASLVALQAFLLNLASVISSSSATAPTALQMRERQMRSRYHSGEREGGADTQGKMRTETNVAAARAEKERRDVDFLQEIMRRRVKRHKEAARMEEEKRNADMQERVGRERDEIAITAAEEPKERHADPQEIMRRRRKKNEAAAHEPMPPLPRAASSESGDRGRDRGGRILRKEVTSDSDSDSPIGPPPRHAPSPPPPRLRREVTSDYEPDSHILPPSGYSSRYSNTPRRVEEEKLQLVESVTDLEEGERKERRTNDETKVVPPVIDRWEKIRRNAAERAAKRQIEEQSSGGYNQKTDEDNGNTSGEETIESRVVRIKARAAELTANMDTPNNQTTRSQPHPKVTTENKTITIQPKTKSKHKADVPKPPEPAMNDSNIGRAYPIPEFGRTPDLSLPMAPNKVTVTITIVSAQLKKANFFSRSPDPYVRMGIDGKSYRTSPVSRTANPYWGQKFPEVQVTKDTIVLFDVLDHRDYGAILGTVKIHVWQYLDYRSDKAQATTTLSLTGSNNNNLVVRFKPKIYPPKIETMQPTP